MDDQAIMAYLQAIGLGSGMPQGATGQPAPQMQMPQQQPMAVPMMPQAAPPAASPAVPIAPQMPPQTTPGGAPNYQTPYWMVPANPALHKKPQQSQAAPTAPKDPNSGAATPGSGNLGDGATDPNVMGGPTGFSFGGLF